MQELLGLTEILFGRLSGYGYGDYNQDHLSQMIINNQRRLMVFRAYDEAMVDALNNTLAENPMHQARRSLEFPRRPKKPRVGEVGKDSAVASIPLAEANEDNAICIEHRKGDIFDDDDVSDLHLAWKLREELFSNTETKLYTELQDIRDVMQKKLDYSHGPIRKRCS